MTLKVIGAGFGRTGTLSLKTALESLGYNKCYHMIELLNQPQQVKYWERASRKEAVAWDTLFEDYQATVDFPGYRFYRQLMQQYPEAKVILTVRDPLLWYESTYETIYQASPKGWQKVLLFLQFPFSSRLRKLVRVFKLADYEIWLSEFQGRFEDKDFAIKIFNNHIETVKKVVPPEKLLVFNVEEGWKPLCKFLGVPEPIEPFPRKNKRAEFGQFKHLINGKF